jgi:hypothetical protein
MKSIRFLLVLAVVAFTTMATIAVSDGDPQPEPACAPEDS